MKEESIGHSNNEILCAIEENNHFMTLPVTICALVSRFKIGPTEVVTLEKSLIDAFYGALESSSLNPKLEKEGI